MVAAARTPTKLYSVNYGNRLALYMVPNVTSDDTADVGSTGTNDFTKVFLAVEIGLKNAALTVTTLTNATNLTLAQTGLTGEDAVLLVIGSST